MAGPILAVLLLCVPLVVWTFLQDLFPSISPWTAVPESPSSSDAASQPAEPESQPTVQTVHFSATGDNLIHAPIYTQAKPDQLIGAFLTVQLEKTTEPDGSIHCAVFAPKLWPTVTHYGAGKANMRTYLLQDYIAELAKAHGVRQEYPEFSLECIQSTVRENIDPEFLQLT